MSFPLRLDDLGTYIHSPKYKIPWCSQEFYVFPSFTYTMMFFIMWSCSNPFFILSCKYSKIWIWMPTNVGNSSSSSFRTTSCAFFLKVLMTTLTMLNLYSMVMSNSMHKYFHLAYLGEKFGFITKWLVTMLFIFMKNGFPNK